MKKFLSVCLAGTFLLGALFTAAACADTDKDPDVVQGDKEAPAFSDAQATLSVSGDLNAMGAVDISDSIYGAFLEDINYASYAMNDNLIANGSFEDANGRTNSRWTGVTTTTTGGVLAANSDYSKNSIGTAHAIVSVGSGGATAVNSGYAAFGIAIEEGVDYVFSAFIKTDAAVTLTVRAKSGETVCLEQEIAIAANTDWVKYQRTVKATASASENVKIELAFTSDTTASVHLDGVALETTDSTVGVKNYIYNAIRDLSPAFIRFPGGCVTEGINEAGAYDWKNSIGAVVTGTAVGDDDVPAFTYLLDTDGTPKSVTTYGEAVARKHNTDIWGYDMDYELGFFEYFLLCESVGASAVPVLSCGLSDQGGFSQVTAAHALKGRHNKLVQDYIRDAIDLIEFALGEKTTKWGGIRAAMGHEKPFEMHYIGIGNEQYGNYYKDYYEKFLQNKEFMAAIKKYELQVIVGNNTQFYHCENVPTSGSKGEAQNAAEAFLKDTNRNNDGEGNRIITQVGEYGVHDQHYYRNYYDFFKYHTLYDSYLRGELGYDVFVGEYSANEAKTLDDEDYGFDNFDWRNSWITALSEAAMMTGFERNGDVVKLAAYAPMFAPWSGNNINADGGVSNRQWPVDMMYFTETKLVLTTNYYVQQIFMQNAGTYLADYKMTFASGFAQTYELSNAAGTVSHEIDKLYYVASVDEKTGDIIVKIVNAGSEAVKVNVALTGATLTGLAHVTVLQNDDYKAVNTLENLASPAIAPDKYTIYEFTDGNTFGYEAKGYSVTAFRVHTK